MRLSKRIIWGVLLVIAAFLIFATWYKNTYSMEVATAYSINTPEASTHLLIATQGSEFKDAIVSNIVNQLKERDIFIRVYDVRELEKIVPTQWDAILVLHTWEYGKPPGAVKYFAERYKLLSNALFFTTSGGGTEYVKGYDGISSASKMNSVETNVEEIINWLDKIFNQ